MIDTVKKILVLIFCVWCLFSASDLKAGITGKIAGKVIDDVNGDVLIGVNIMISGTMMGAATDLNGHFSILNVPPGIYTLTAQAIGYKKVAIQNVKVSIDLTTRVDFVLPEDVLELGETVYVTAERPLITKDLTASTAVIGAEDIQALPVTEFREILDLQAGVVDGHVRGGRTGEVVYAIDGVPVTDTYDGSNVIDVNTNAIQELQFVSGAFNAEYGKALSGYVNIATREADDKLRYGISTYVGDHVSDNTQIFRAIDRVNPVHIQNVDGFLSTPIISNTLFAFANVRYYYSGSYLRGKRVYNPWDITINHGATESIESRYTILSSGDNEIVDMDWNRKIYAHGKLTWKPVRHLKFNYNFLMDLDEFQLYDHYLSLNPDGNLNRFKDAYTHIIGMTHILSEKTFYQFNISRFSKKYKHFVYEDYNDPRYTDYRLQSQEPGEVPSFDTGGTNNQHFERQTSSLGFKFDLTNQINQYHQLKFGFDLTRYELTYKDLYLIQEGGLQDPSETLEPFVSMRVPDPNDPNENLSIHQYQHEPVEFSVYAQDKLEFKYFIINIGLRFDSFIPDGHVPVDLTDPDIYRPRRPENIDNSFEDREEYWYSDATTKYKVSPRLGISFPITDRGMFYFSYGHFFQTPNFELLYRNSEYKFTKGSGHVGVAGNADLKPEETISGEVGFRQAITDAITIDITGYFRDIRNLTGTRSDEIIMYGGASRYSQLVNSDFGLVRGIVFTAEKRFDNNWSAKFDYTLQVAKGNASDPTATMIQVLSLQEPEIQMIRLNFDQTQTVNASFSYRSSQNWGFSLIGKYESGLPYTPTQSINLSKLLTNSETKPSNMNLDLKAYKDFNLGKYRFSIFARIYNLFDIENEIDVYPESGTADFSIFEYQRKQQNLPELVNSIDRYYRNPLFYSEPRRVEVGCSFNFNN